MRSSVPSERLRLITKYSLVRQKKDIFEGTLCRLPNSKHSLQNITSTTNINNKINIKKLYLYSCRSTFNIPLDPPSVV